MKVEYNNGMAFYFVLKAVAKFVFYLILRLYQAPQIYSNVDDNRTCKYFKSAAPNYVENNSTSSIKQAASACKQ